MKEKGKKERRNGDRDKEEAHKRQSEVGNEVGGPGLVKPSKQCF